MFQKILVALDRSAMGAQVFHAALDLAKSTNACLKLFHVLALSEPDHPTMTIANSQGYLPWIDSSASLQAYEQMWEAYEAKSREILQAFASQANEAGVKVEIHQCGGAPGRTICEVAAAWGAELIAIGRRGHSGIGELLLGSVSNYVLHHAHCSVLTVQGSTQSDLDRSRSESVAVRH
jgi:nucleotide-binding universal stress UspA family protein